MLVVYYVIFEVDISWGDLVVGDMVVDGFEDVWEVDLYYFVKL